MLSKDIFETDPLYRRRSEELQTSGLLPAGLMYYISNPSINLHCPTCGSAQTFVPAEKKTNLGMQLHNDWPLEWTQTITFKCAGCDSFTRIFLLHLDIADDGDFQIQKAGQYPAIDITIPREISKGLGEFEALYKKGKINESQSYGIGAFIYYRRVIDGIIDNLLEKLEDLISKDNLDAYKTKLLEAKKSKVSTDKINLVKDLVPDTLRPGGLNPLQIIYDSLSIGLHQKTDEECLELAVDTRIALDYFIVEILKAKTTSDQFTAALSRLSDKKGGKEKKD